MKERLLVLAKATPVISKKYEHLVCVGGITEDGNWRRLYPVPWKVFWSTSRNRFRKKYWIEYELESTEPSDHRPESRKVRWETIRELERQDYPTIKRVLDGKVTTLEKLMEIPHQEVSMGVVKPAEILDFLQEGNENYEKYLAKKGQQTLEGSSAVKIEIPDLIFSYKFRCSPECPGEHKIMCEDWEVTELYRNLNKRLEEGKYRDREEVIEKMRQKLLEEIPNKGDFYFLLGTHYRFHKYIIISVIYPDKQCDTDPGYFKI